MLVIKIQIHINGKSCAFGGMTIYKDYSQHLMKPQNSLCWRRDKEERQCLLTLYLAGATVSSSFYIINAEGLRRRLLVLSPMPFPVDCWVRVKALVWAWGKDLMLRMVEQERRVSSQEHHPIQETPGFTHFPPSWWLMNLYEFNYSHLGFLLLAVEGSPYVHFVNNWFQRQKYFNQEKMNNLFKNKSWNKLHFLRK